MNLLIVIPARLSSSRVPNKPLQMINGKTVVHRVWDRVMQATKIIQREIPKANIIVVVATESKKVVSEAESFGALAVITDGYAENGTERTYEIANRFNVSNHTLILNVQGDGYDVAPEAIAQLVNDMANEGAININSRIRTLYCMYEPLPENERDNDSIVKVIVNNAGNATHFTRSYLPGAHKHCGIYGYYMPFLSFYKSWLGRKYENMESLEQMRVLEHGGIIHCFPLTACKTAGKSINIMDDLDEARK